MPFAKSSTPPSDAIKLFANFTNYFATLILFIKVSPYL
jgi:hypothetical protein